MIRLPVTFRSEGFEFKQFARKGNVALFRKTKFLKRTNPPSEFETFEVVVLHTLNFIGDQNYRPSTSEDVSDQKLLKLGGYAAIFVDRAARAFGCKLLWTLARGDVSIGRGDAKRILNLSVFSGVHLRLMTKGCHELFVRNKAVHNIHNQALSLGWHIKHEAAEPITRAI